MYEKFVTVLMPLRNYHPIFLRKAIKSIFDQSYPYWDLIIIVERRDYRKFRKFLQIELEDRRLQIVINEGRKLSGAINTGMKYAKTEYTAILLADDMWAPEAVEVLTDHIKKIPEADFYHSSRRYINEDGDIISSIYQSRENVTLDDFRAITPVKHLLCWRKSKAISVGGLDESLNSVGPDDFDFPWTMAENGAVFKSIKECLYFYRDHRESFRLTTHIPLSVHKREIERILRKHGSDSHSIVKRVRLAENSYLNQCLFKSNFDRILKELTGYDAKAGGRQEYD